MIWKERQNSTYIWSKSSKPDFLLEWAHDRLNNIPICNIKVSISHIRLSNMSDLCPSHVVTFTLISILATDCIQKRRGQFNS